MTLDKGGEVAQPADAATLGDRYMACEEGTKDDPASWATSAMSWVGHGGPTRQQINKKDMCYRSVKKAHLKEAFSYDKKHV
jgi:hypothetical protein